MAKYRKTFLQEVERFDRCNRQSGSSCRTDEGLSQFHAHESRGQYPESPDTYFLHLLNGKRWWEWTLNEYAALYGTPEWPGWLCLYLDFQKDERGFRQLCRRLRTDADIKIAEMKVALELDEESKKGMKHVA